MYISDRVHYVGVNDKELDLFEGLYIVPNGMSYNSYVIIDEKIAVMDTVEVRFGGKWLKNVENALPGRQPDYLIVQHMEPDHSANISLFMQKYPKAKVVATRQAFVMMQNYFGTDYADRREVAGDGDSLFLGKGNLQFITAPMVHWPEVMMAYDTQDKILFSADAFGKFGALDKAEEWVCEARRYYFGIVGKYGVQVRAVLQKLRSLDIRMICSLHGSILDKNVQSCLGLYETWSNYEAEEDGVCIAYTSVYGNTKKAVEYLAEELKSRGVKVSVFDLARTDVAEVIEDAFKYSKSVFATTTYNGGIFPFMREFLFGLAERNYQKRRVGLIENGSWSPMAAQGMKEYLDKCERLQFIQPTVKILSSPTQETYAQLRALADALI